MTTIDPDKELNRLKATINSIQKIIDSDTGSSNMKLD